MTLVLLWRVPERRVGLRWRGPAGLTQVVAREPLAPVAAVVGPPGPGGTVAFQPLAVLANAIAPVPADGIGSAAWSTLLSAPVIWDGVKWRTFTSFIETQAPRPEWVPATALMVRDWENDRYWRADLGICTVDDVACFRPEWGNPFNGTTPGIGLESNPTHGNGAWYYNSAGVPDEAFAVINDQGFAAYFEWEATDLVSPDVIANDQVSILLYLSDAPTWTINVTGNYWEHSGQRDLTGWATLTNAPSPVTPLPAQPDRLAFSFDATTGKATAASMGVINSRTEPGDYSPATVLVLEAATKSVMGLGTNAIVTRDVFFPKMSDAELLAMAPAPGPPPAFSLDFTTGTLDPAVTLTRASSGMRINSSGTLVTETTDVARFDYEPVSHVPLGLLVEPAATNLLLRSAEFDNASWIKSGASVTADAIAAPDGTATADLYSASAHANDSNGYIIQQVASSGGATLTHSVYVKAKAWQWLRMGIYDNGWHTAWFDIANGVVGTKEAGVTASIQSVGDGWYRLSVTYTASFANAYAGYWLADADNSVAGSDAGANGAYMWGAQIEATPAATTYIATAGAAATRAVDNLSVTVPSGFGHLTVTFDDDSTQSVVCVTGVNAYTSADFDRTRIKSMVGVA